MDVHCTKKLLVTESHFYIKSIYLTTILLPSHPKTSQIQVYKYLLRKKTLISTFIVCSFTEMKSKQPLKNL